MPLLYRKEIAPDTLFGIWKMDETESVLLQEHPFLHRHIDVLDNKSRHTARRMEFLCTRLLAALLLNDTTIDIGYTDSGKPILSNGMHISISHTRGYAAVVVSKTYRSGIDIERKGRNLQRIQAHFMRHDERADTDEELLMHWCSKEALYKLFSEDRLMTSEIRLVCPNTRGAKAWQAVNMKRNVSVDIHQYPHTDFLLVWVLSM